MDGGYALLQFYRAHALKRIPRIKFPNRHQKPSGSTSEAQALSSKSDGSLSFFSSSNASTTLGGKASLQPKRTPVTNEEIDAVLGRLKALMIELQSSSKQKI
ncbi:hypothetical protein MTR_8g099465 [Medicago truncatula]|uniref:Uncharacterized protein n=1 Tax=Medicago truncatula TaxID=3880 RepID=A0A072TUM1_MEDTR|nr:hypothetical protein MTR_8g099465 [Medicago truncatula]